MWSKSWALSVIRPGGRAPGLRPLRRVLSVFPALYASVSFQGEGSLLPWGALAGWGGVANESEALGVRPLGTAGSAVGVGSERLRGGVAEGVPAPPPFPWLRPLLQASSGVPSL